jgi:hypothetical protein
VSHAEGAGRDLLTLAERMWTPFGGPDWPVVVSTGPLPASHVPAEEYVVVPDLRRPRFLVPVRAARASRASFSRFNTTSSRRTRVSGYASAVGFGTPAGERVFRSRLVVGIDRTVDRADWSRWLLLAHLQEVLGAADLVAFLPVRRAMPNAKPTMRLFERDGRPLGYAKVGWSEATRAVVENEARALAEVQGHLQRLRAPALTTSGTWHDHVYAVAAPLPPHVGAWTAEPSTTPELLRDIVASGTASRGTLAESGFARRVRTQLEAAGAAEPEAVAVVLEWLGRLEERADVLEFGRWHGDYVPWNLGRSPHGPVAWDWEYSDPDVPVGLDLVHWHFQHRLAPGDGTLAAATAVADREADRLTVLDVERDSAHLVVSAYLLEIFTRAIRMAAAGAGWNPKLYPALLDVARERDR